MWLTPSSTARRRTACAVSTSSGRPQMPLPVSRIAPKPRRLTSSSPAILKVPEAVAVGMAGGLPSEHGQVALELPGADLHAVVLPLLALDLDVAVEHVLAERAQDELGLRRDLDRLAERLRQLLDAEPPPLLGRQVVEVLVHRLRQVVALLDALEPRLQERGERQVRVARRVRTAQLHARRLLLARVVEGHADERAAVAPRPREVDGRLIAGDEALVAVHPLGEDRADLPRVAQLAGDERLADVGEEVRVVLVEEGVAPPAEERLVRVHARAVLAEQRLGHERRMPAVLHRVLLDRDAVRHAVVGHLQRLGVAHVDLVLARPDLVVRVLDVDAQLLEREHGLAAHVRAGVERREVEVAALVEGLRAAAVLEVEVLELGTDVEGVEAHLVHALERATEHVARVALVRRALRREDVAEHPPDALALGAPRQDREGRRVRHRDHVRLLDRVEARDRRAVEAHAPLERVVELGDVDRERLQLTQDVGEPEADEAHVALVADRLDVVRGLRLVGHGRDPSGLFPAWWTSRTGPPVHRRGRMAACLLRPTPTGSPTCRCSARRSARTSSGRWRASATATPSSPAIRTCGSRTRSSTTR